MAEKTMIELSVGFRPLPDSTPLHVDAGGKKGAVGDLVEAAVAARGFSGPTGRCRAHAAGGYGAGSIRTERPELVLLDLMLPGTGGSELKAEVPELSDPPVIFLSGYGRDESIARAFEAGAADYVIRPFSPTELSARVGTALRACAGAAPCVLGALAIDYERRRVTVDGHAVALTATEYEILRILSVNAGRVVTSESLRRQAWDGRARSPPPSACAFVRQLHAKLGDDAARPARIFAGRGVG